MKILAFDPGVTTGWVFMDENGVIDGDNAKTFEDVVKAVLRYPQAEAIVCEDYIFRPGNVGAHMASKAIAAQIKKYLEGVAIMQKIPFQLYSSDLKPVQQKRSGKKPGAHKYSHYIDAYNHGWWYLYKLGLVKTDLQKKKAAQ